VITNGCLLCHVEEADLFFGRQRVWEDEYWRLSVVLRGAVVGFAHLEPHRHIPFITDLDGGEAATLGLVLARVSAALRVATAADKVYVYVFGDRIPHLHFNLAPHMPDSPLVGGQGVLREDAPELDRAVHQRVAATVADALAS
jgi:diadenosine tetraphosphate (Ap4A) HIT family hydrolase